MNYKIILIIIVLIVVNGCESVTISENNESSSTEMPIAFRLPSYVNISLEQAKSISESSPVTFRVNYLSENDLFTIFGADQANWPISGTVISQKPSPNTILYIRERIDVDLDVANWEETEPNGILVMPNLIDEPQNLALLKSDTSIEVRESLASLTQVLHIFGNDATLWPSEGTIVAQSPMPGSSIGNYATVNFIGSPAQYANSPIITNIKGKNITEATTDLTSIGISFSASAQSADQLAALYGNEIDNWPEENSVISIYVDDNLAVTAHTAAWSEQQLFPKPLPEVVGLSIDRANEAIATLGYQVVVEELSTSAPKNTVLAIKRRINPELLSGEVLLQVSMLDNPPPPDIAPEPEPEPVIPPSLDSDGDGVVDSKDKCPDTDIAVDVDEDGCTTDDLAKRLEFGRYFFLPESNPMKAGRERPYVIKVKLQTAANKTPALAHNPTPEEFESLAGEVPETLVGELESVRNSQEVSYIDQKWAPKMTLTLSAKNSDTVIIEDPASITKNVDRPITTWEWNIKPKCTGLFSCEPLELSVKAVADFSKGRTYDLFKDQKIILEITPDEIVSSIWQEWKTVIISGVLTVIILPFVYGLLSGSLLRNNG